MDLTDPSPGFRLERICFRRASRDILRNLDFHIRGGETHALVGAKGTGKSVLCALLAGDLPPDSGAVTAPSPSRIMRVTDSAAVFPHMPIADNLILDHDRGWLSWLRLGGREQDKLRRWLAGHEISLPLHLPLQSLPKEDWLFVQIVNRLYQNPDLLIFDETLESLSPRRLQQLWPLVEAQRKRGTAILWVTSRVESALVKADRISILRNGRILLTESVQRLDRLGLISLCHGFLEAPENDLSSQEQFLQIIRFTEALLRDLPSAVIITDMNNMVRFVNSRGGRFFGLSEQWTPGKTLLEVFGDKNARLAATISEAFTGKGECEWHSLPLDIGDRRRLADIRLQRVKEGEVTVGHLLIIEDVSPREEMRRRLMLAENVTSIGLLAAGVAHEVNNPLEAMENYLNYLGETEGHADRREIIREVTRETHNIRETVRQLVAFSGHRNANRVKTDMATLITRLCALLKYHVRGKGIDFTVIRPAEKVMVAAAPNEMRQMLLNLIRNGIDAMPEGGTIAIGMAVTHSEGNPDTVRLWIEDEGCGIDAEDMNEIFLPFVSGKKGENNHQGLGLWIVYTIVEHCGGTIAVENRPEGGCRFTLCLPCTIEGGR